MHIQPKNISQYPFYLRWFFRQQEKKMGQILLPGLFWGRIPLLQVLFLVFWRHLDRKGSHIDPALRSLVQVRVAQLNWCEFCIDINSLNLLKRANSVDKAHELQNWKNSATFSDTEKSVLEYVEVVSKDRVKVPEEVMLQLKRIFSDDQIVELTALIAFQNMSAKFNAALAIPAQGLCKMPELSKK